MFSAKNKFCESQKTPNEGVKNKFEHVYKPVLNEDHCLPLGKCVVCRRV